MADFATIEDVNLLFRQLTAEEEPRAIALLEVVSNTLRLRADNVGKNLDEMVLNDENYASVVKSVVIDIVGRALMTSTNSQPMTQYSEAALGYSVSGTFLNPGGGLFIKNSEYALLGLKRQRYGGIDYYDTDKGYNCSLNTEIRNQ